MSRHVAPGAGRRARVPNPRGWFTWDQTHSRRVRVLIADGRRDRRRVLPERVRCRHLCYLELAARAARRFHDEQRRSGHASDESKACRGPHRRSDADQTPGSVGAARMPASNSVSRENGSQKPALQQTNGPTQRSRALDAMPNGPRPAAALLHLAPRVRVFLRARARGTSKSSFARRARPGFSARAATPVPGSRRVELGTALRNVNPCEETSAHIQIQNQCRSNTRGADRCANRHGTRFLFLPLSFVFASVHWDPEHSRCQAPEGRARRGAMLRSLSTKNIFVYSGRPPSFCLLCR